jgi:hypothetical protein
MPRVALDWGRRISRRNIVTAHANTMTVVMNSRGDGPQGSAEVRKRGGLDWLLKQSFAEGVSWPIDRASPRALVDLGLTVAQIARYFSTNPVEVQALLGRRQQAIESPPRLFSSQTEATKIG